MEYAEDDYLMISGSNTSDSVKTVGADPYRATVG